MLEIELAPSIITIRLEPAFEKYPLIPIRAEHRQLFPRFREPFLIEADGVNFETRVVGASAVIGDTDAGVYLRKGITEWQRRHPNLHGGDEVQIEIIEPMHKYKLEAP